MMARVTLALVLCAACASTPSASGDDENAQRAFVPGLEGCQVKVDANEGRTVLCGQHMGALVPAAKADADTLVGTFLDGVAKGAGAKVEREPAERDIAGTIASGVHAWFTNKNGVLVDGWLGVVTAGGERRLVGCFLLGQSHADRCPVLLKVLRDAPMFEAGRYPVDVLGTRALPPDGCELSDNRAACGNYEFQWYPDGARLSVDLFVGKFLESGSTLAARDVVTCRALGSDAQCEKVSLHADSGNVDVYFAHPATGGVVLCIVEEGSGLQPMCRAFMSTSVGEEER